MSLCLLSLSSTMVCPFKTIPEPVPPPKEWKTRNPCSPVQLSASFRTLQLSTNYSGVRRSYVVSALACQTKGPEFGSWPSMNRIVSQSKSDEDIEDDLWTIVRSPIKYFKKNILQYNWSFFCIYNVTQSRDAVPLKDEIFLLLYG